MGNSNIASELALLHTQRPKGWRILASGIDPSLGNKYIRILFTNDLVASVVSGPHTYGGSDGLWEIAPCWYFGGGTFTTMWWDELRGVLDWDDIKGYLDVADVRNCLDELASVDAFRVSTLRAAYMAIRTHKYGGI